MAWIESHQELARHPKTRKLSRKLGISVPAAIGHLHMLWWWALDYAQDGNISDFEPDDIADAIDWQSDADDLLTALIDSGFVEKQDNLILIHDWFDYAGRLVDKREQNRERKRKSRANKTNKQDGHEEVTRPSQGQINDDSFGHGATEQNRTVPNQTEPKTSTTTAGEPPLNPFKLFESEGFGTISMTIGDRIRTMCEEYGDRWVCEAMKKAVVAGKRNLGYVDGILKRFKSEGVDDPWNVSAPSQSTSQQRRTGTSSQSRSGKGSIPIVEDRPSEKVSQEEFDELRRIARKLDGKEHVEEPVPY